MEQIEQIKKVPVCDCCGLCCQQLIVEADAIDVLREPQIAKQRPLGRRSASLEILEACWIVAMPGKPCPFLTTKRRCSVYPTRPAICVAFVAGSSQCQQVRRKSGLPPLKTAPAMDILAEIQIDLLEEPKTSQSAPLP